MIDLSMAGVFLMSASGIIKTLSGCDVNKTPLVRKVFVVGMFLAGGVLLVIDALVPIWA
jgi:hypothetical protein